MDYKFNIVMDYKFNIVFIFFLLLYLLYELSLLGIIELLQVIDNLIKGASGQAIHNMNLMFGLDQKIGLGLKSSGF